MEVDARFEQLYEADYLKVFRAVYLASGDRRTAEDSTQEAFARALERWDRLGDKDYVSAWIMTTALNVALRSFRHRFHRLVDPPPPEETEGPSEIRLDLWRGIRALPSRQRKSLLLHYFAGLPVSDVASLLGCREGTVKSHLSRARDAIRRYLQEEDDE